MKYCHSWRLLVHDEENKTLIMELPEELQAVSSFFGSEISHGDISHYMDRINQTLEGVNTNDGHPGNAYVLNVYPEKCEIHCVFIDSQAVIETDELIRLMKIWSEAHRMFCNENVPLDQLP